MQVEEKENKLQKKLGNAIGGLKAAFAALNPEKDYDKVKAAVEEVRGDLDEILSMVSKRMESVEVREDQDQSVLSRVSSQIEKLGFAPHTPQPSLQERLHRQTRDLAKTRSESR